MEGERRTDCKVTVRSLSTPIAVLLPAAWGPAVAPQGFPSGLGGQQSEAGSMTPPTQRFAPAALTWCKFALVLLTASLEPNARQCFTSVATADERGRAADLRDAQLAHA